MGSKLFLHKRTLALGRGLNSAENKQILDPYWDFDYSLVFATKNTNDNYFTIRNVIDRNIGLNSMTLYYLSLDLKLNEFNRVSNPRLKGNPNSYINDYYGSIPIMISSKEVTKFLYYNDGHWYEYVEVTH